MSSSLVICCKDNDRSGIIAILERGKWSRIARMTYELLIALLGFAFVTSVTPGPNNMMLLASGVNFGLRRTVPHMLGISVGHSVMVFLLGLGVAGVITALPWAGLALKVLSVGYMLWLAWKIAHAAAPGDGRSGGKPFGFLQAAAFQWVNPKAWAMALGAVTAYAPSGSVGAVALVAVVFACVNLPSVTLWVAAGQAVRRWLDGPGRLRAFNWGMAGLLVLSLWPVVTMEF
jgi:threonine/homoserine/homoserine lactone efflux protein